MSNTKEKLIDLLGETVADCMPTECLCDIADHLIANGVTLANQVASSSKQVASSKWIPVTERLPKNDTAVLVYHNFGRSIFWYDSKDGFCELIFGERYPNYNVTHWMPLPQPPKGE